MLLSPHAVLSPLARRSNSALAGSRFRLIPAEPFHRLASFLKDVSAPLKGVRRANPHSYPPNTSPSRWRRWLLLRRPLRGQRARNSGPRPTDIGGPGCHLIPWQLASSGTRVSSQFGGSPRIRGSLLFRLPRIDAGTAQRLFAAPKSFRGRSPKALIRAFG